MAKHTSLGGRFVGFAGGHFMLSAVGAGASFITATAGILYGLVLLTGVLMLLYLPVGAFVAWLLGWSRPTRREWLQAVGLTGGLACLWGFGGFGLCLVESVAGIGFGLLMSTAILANPSFCFMLCVLVDALDVTGSGWALSWYAATAVAALLPPVLFFTGALLVPGRGSAAPGEGGAALDAPVDSKCAEKSEKSS